jgi:hypothetical protein
VYVIWRKEIINLKTQLETHMVPLYLTALFFSPFHHGAARPSPSLLREPWPRDLPRPDKDLSLSRTRTPHAVCSQPLVFYRRDVSFEFQNLAPPLQEIGNLP